MDLLNPTRRATEAAQSRQLAFPVHVASSRAQARAECEPGLLRFLRVATEAALPLVQGDPKSFEAFRQVRARMES
jgi:hypothetical protein